jgi:hypothetical protein
VYIPGYLSDQEGSLAEGNDTKMRGTSAWAASSTDNLLRQTSTSTVCISTNLDISPTRKDP